MSPDDGHNEIRLGPGVSVPESAVRVKFVRGRGPGGQNVNKVSTAAELRIRLSDLQSMPERAMRRLREQASGRIAQDEELVLFCDEHRSQERNREAAIDRLREIIVRALHEPKKRRPTKPSRASRQRRLEGKKRRGEIKSMRRSVD
ncbi:MAG TPA: alternative ribosome rescue aminoacyl-tRNA hydrolase ArfB [Tepidisphaeraceae bacterium]|nr:alternative ribosome rescue aminoacyl-tRNA hydrolase ArfB [Tepidisphaeraceae bacterium]